MFIYTLIFCLSLCLRYLKLKAQEGHQGNWRAFLQIWCWKMLAQYYWISKVRNLRMISTQLYYSNCKYTRCKCKGPKLKPLSCNFLSLLKKKNPHTQAFSVTSISFFDHTSLTDDNSNQSFLSDAYQSNNKVDSSSNSSPQHASGAVSPTHAPYFRTEDSQPPTLGQETMEGKARRTFFTSSVTMITLVR